MTELSWITKDWTFTLGGAFRIEEFNEASLAVQNNIVYANDFNALDTQTGQPLSSWRPADTVPTTSPAIANGTVYFVGLNGKVYAVDATTGAMRDEWGEPVQKLSASGSQWTRDDISHPVVANGVVYFVNTLSGEVHALDAHTGEPPAGWNGRFTTPRNDVGGTPPAVHDDTIYFATYTNLYAIDAETGEPPDHWDEPIHTPQGTLTGTPTVTDNTVYIGDMAGYLYAINTETGCRHDAWTPFRLKSPTSPAIYPRSPAVVDDTVYVSGYNEWGADGAVYALDATTGRPHDIWDGGAFIPATEGTMLTSTAVSNETVYVGDSASATVYAIAADTGTLRWSLSPVDVLTSPVVCDDSLYVGGHLPTHTHSPHSRHHVEPTRCISALR